MKKCLNCNESKSLDCFGNHKITEDGLNYNCKKCCSEQQLKFRRSKLGLISNLFTSQKSSSIKRNHKPPTYTLDDLIRWIFNQENFEELFNNWVESEYKSDLKPSCDRKDESLGYSLDNIRLVTWLKNKKEHHKKLKSGESKVRHKRVIGTCLKTGKIEFFPSTRSAGRKHKTDHVHQCCSGKRKSASGFKWEYVHDKRPYIIKP